MSKLFHTTRELSSSTQHVRGGGSGGGDLSATKAIPFHHCALSCTPCTAAWADSDGNIFDIASLVPHVKKHGTHPLTGAKCALSDFFEVNFGKDKDGNFECAGSQKRLTDRSKIVVIRNTGNVYLAETVEELNFKAKNLADLVTGEPFTRADVITIQDPDRPRRARKREAESGAGAGAPKKVAKTEPASSTVESTINLRAGGSTLQKIMAKMKAAGATSDAPPLVFTPSVPDKPDPLVALAQKKVDSSAFVRISTTLGDLNLELFARDAPKACLNFLTLAGRGYYRNTVFHRLVPGFMIQGGDPTGTGRGGSSCFGKDFEDEIKGNPNLHSQRGTVSMANKGANTNASQFFITFGPQPSLDAKHTVFGKVVGGIKVLDEMEKAERKGERPVEPIIIHEVTVFVNPFDEEKE
jgi:peptidyl-prolyl cis-trans isomerase-like protein 2